MLWLAVIAPALAQDCQVAYPDACISNSTTVEPTAIIGVGVDVGAGMDIRAGATLSPRCTIGARDVVAVPFVGEGAMVGRNAWIGDDLQLGDGSVIGRAATIGDRLDAADLVIIGYGAILGDGVTLSSGATIGNLAQIGSGSGLGVGAVVGRDTQLIGAVQLSNGVRVSPEVDITGPVILGPQVTVRTGASIAANAVIGTGATIGRDVVILGGAEIGAGAVIQAGARVEANAVVDAGTVVARGAVISGGPSQGGGGAIGEADDGSNIAYDVNFRAPTATGGLFDEWTNGTEALVSDDVAAYTGTVGARQSFESFGFSVPGSNQITGVSVKIDGSASSTVGVLEVALSWDGGTTWSATRSTGGLTVGDVVHTVGGGSDNWGHSWTPAQTNNTNFKVRVTSNQPIGHQVRLDGVQVRIHHQATGGSQGGGGAI